MTMHEQLRQERLISDKLREDNLAIWRRLEASLELARQLDNAIPEMSCLLALAICEQTRANLAAGESAAQWGQKLAAIGLGAIGIQQVVSAISAWTAASANQIRAEEQLQQTLGRNAGATEAEIQGLKDLASAQQELTGYGDEVTIQQQAMLSTFGLNAEMVAVLTPRLLDLAESIAWADARAAEYLVRDLGREMDLMRLSDSARICAAMLCRMLGVDLRAAILERREKGIATYGRPLRYDDGRGLVDAAQEAIDLAAYLLRELGPGDRP
jgi:hypothetical protein